MTKAQWRIDGNARTEEDVAFFFIIYVRDLCIPASSAFQDELRVRDRIPQLKIYSQLDRYDQQTTNTYEFTPTATYAHPASMVVAIADVAGKEFDYIIVGWCLPE